jgi:hypothetical protein
VGLRELDVTMTVLECLEEACRAGEKAARAETIEEKEILLDLMAQWLEIAKDLAAQESASGWSKDTQH